MTRAPAALSQVRLAPALKGFCGSVGPVLVRLTVRQLTGRVTDAVRLSALVAIAVDRRLEPLPNQARSDLVITGRPEEREAPRHHVGREDAAVHEMTEVHPGIAVGLQLGLLVDRG